MPLDFHHANLRGRSFKNKDCTGADFSYADIRGANFTKANLTGTNFSYAQAGLQRRWVVGLVTCSLVLSALSGLIAAYAGSLIGSLLIRDGTLGEYSFSGLFTSIVLAVFFVITIRNSIVSALGVLPLTVAWAIAVIAIGDTGAEVGVLLGALALAGAVVGSLGLAGAMALAKTVAFTPAMGLAGVAALVGSVAGYLFGRGSLVVSALVAATVVILGTYVGWRALAGDGKYALIRKIALFLAAIGSTSFRGANLTDAKFTQATLKNTQLLEATLTRTTFYRAQKLHLARVGGTYLDNPKVRQWVVTGYGQDKNFDRLNLGGINLQGANLADASFIGANLREANLQDTDLSRAQLVQTQLDQTDLTGATVTGATIQDWGITSSTKLHGVRCEYIFMRVPTPEDPNPRRKPDNWEEEFADDDFADFITPIVKTLDLYHNQDVDPRAIAVAYRNLAENHPEAALDIVAMEVRGKNKDKFLLRVETSEEAHHSELNAEYFQDYHQIKSLPRESLLLLLAERDNQISRLESTISNALSSSMVAPETVQYPVPRQQNKRVILNIGAGNFDTGFPAITALILADNNRIRAQSQGQLPPNPELPQLYYRWQSVHYGLSGMPLPKYNPGSVTRGSKKQLRQLEHELRNCLNSWLDSESFRAMEQEVRDNLTKSEEVQCIIQTENIQLRRLPWHLWDLFESYRKAEVALSTPVYEGLDRNRPRRNRVRILGVLGDNSTGINIIKDRQLLEEYDAETVFLVESPRTELLTHLWDEESWDILSFSGHSSSEWTGKKGWIYINKTDKLELDYLKTALRAAINNGLQLAIFNSCDGLGLASQLADLQIPQLIVMGEPVPDLVAQEFLQNFLKAFAAGKSFYLAVRQAREMLQSLEAECPCATWLPVICQNPAELPPLWSDLQRRSSKNGV